MSAAAAQPTFDPSGAPLSVLVDFDGTISLEDVGDVILTRLVEDQAEVARQDRLYDEGRIGSRELMRWDMDVLPRDPERLRAEVAQLSLDSSFTDLVRTVRGVGGVVEIVSDGVGFHIEEMLAQLGLEDLPVATNMAIPGLGGEGVSFPYGNSACFVCGTCKRERVRLHQEAGRATVFVGNGTSDRYAAHHADLVFAKSSLAAWCDAEGLAYEPWGRLADVAGWIEAALSDGRLPNDAAAFEAWAVRTRPNTPPFICGPEVWGEGRTVALRSYPETTAMPHHTGPGLRGR